MFHMQERQISLPSLFKKTVHNIIRRFLCLFFLNLDDNLIIFSGLMLIYY